ncbi:MAG: radical SAM protein [Oscillospiraceae bacterium]|nr:radical SAM protein [Oscillospiraceae bacterium]
MYCGIAQNSELRIYQAQKHQLYYEKVFDVLEYAKNKNLISPEALWQISSGEITIHPFKERIFNLVRYKHVHFYTNCFIFDEEIAQILKSNPYAAINLSIDSGTSQTWKKIKGVDNFAVVTENLVKYFTSSSRPGQITLKYIILPGINDTADDFTFVVEIMKILKTGHLTLSRDTGIKYFLGDEESEKLVKSAGRLVSLLQKNGLSFDMFTYLPEERENIIAYAKETV